MVKPAKFVHCEDANLSQVRVRTKCYVTNCVMSALYCLPNIPNTLCFYLCYLFMRLHIFIIKIDFIFCFLLCSFLLYIYILSALLYARRQRKKHSHYIKKMIIIFIII